MNISDIEAWRCPACIFGVPRDLTQRRCASCGGTGIPLPQPTPIDSRKDATTALRIHASPEWRAWLARTLDEGNGLGSDLVETLPGPDTPATAGRLLKAAEALGWIGRGRFAPSQSQQGFDVGGWYRTEEGRQHHAECWTWSVTSEHSTLFPCVAWDDDPRTERLCEDEINDTTCRAPLGACRSCPVQPYRPRPVHPKGLRRA